MIKSILKHPTPTVTFNPKVETRVSYPLEQNPYRTLYVDLNHRCNMACNFCYTPVRNWEDMSLEYFEEVCRRLPNRVWFRFLGGEPTLHPQFFEFIKVAHKYRHLVTFLTNGTTLVRDEFMRELADLNKSIPFVTSLSMDGGKNDDHYEIIANARCADMKMKALTNLRDFGIPRVVITAIVVRGVNEPVVRELYDLSREFKNVRYIHYRSIGRVGRFIESAPYETEELKALLRQYLPEIDVERDVTLNGQIDDGVRKCRNCCYYFNTPDDVEIALIEFANERSAQCWRRGKVVEENFTVQPLFDNMIQKSHFLNKQGSDLHVQWTQFD